MKSKNKQSGTVFRIISEPYKISEKDDFNDFYERYSIDKNKTIEIDKQLFYKALYITKFSLRKDGYILTLSTEMNLKQGMTIIDENGNHFVVSGFEMISFRNVIPKWYSHIACVVVTGKCENIGIYFSVI